MALIHYRDGTCELGPRPTVMCRCGDGDIGDESYVQCPICKGTGRVPDLSSDDLEYERQEGETLAEFNERTIVAAERRRT